MESPYGEESLSGRIVAWLRATLGGASATEGNSGVRELRNNTVAGQGIDLYDLVFDAATAFTDVRRLQILRRIADSGAAGPKTLSSELGMALQAAGRQTDKLIRRGYLIRVGTTCRAVFGISASFKSPVHAALFEIVREHWGVG